MTHSFRSLYTSDDDCARYLFGIVYICVTNMQGDVLGLRNTSGTEVVRYHFDPWGFVFSATGSLATTVGQNQPLRYRGYVYDEETGLYYLQSRYYHPEWGRFISADSVINGNLFAYCKNNPVMQIDTDGFYPILFSEICINEEDDIFKENTPQSGMNHTPIIDAHYCEIIPQTNYRLHFYKNDGTILIYHNKQDELVLIGKYDEKNKVFLSAYSTYEGYLKADYNHLIIRAETSEEFFEYGYYDLQVSSHPSIFVHRLQLKLGFSETDADGYFGPKTKNALIEFQKANGLFPDGIAGPKTKQKLINDWGG